MVGLGGIVASFAAIVGLSDNLGYLLPAIIGLESMGVPSPGETALVAAAILASSGKLNIVLVILKYVLITPSFRNLRADVITVASANASLPRLRSRRHSPADIRAETPAD